LVAPTPYTPFNALNKKGIELIEGGTATSAPDALVDGDSGAAADPSCLRFM